MKHAAALVAVIGAANAISIQALTSGNCLAINGCQERPRTNLEKLMSEGAAVASVNKRDPDPRGGRGGGGSSSSGGSGSGAKDFGKQVAGDLISTGISEGIMIGVGQAVNGQQAPPAPPAPVQKREPDPRGGRGGGSSSSGGGSGSSSSGTKDFGKQVAGDLISTGISEGIMFGVNQAVNGQQQQPPVQKREPDPRGGRGGASSSGGSGSSGAKDFGKQVAQDTASNLISDGIMFGINQAVNGQQPPVQKREPDPRGGRGSASSSTGSGSSGAKDFGKQVAQDTASNLISDGIMFGINQAVNGQQPPVQKREPDPRGGRGSASSSGGSQSGGAKDFGKQVAQDTASNLISDGIMFGINQAVNGQQPPVQKRDPEPRGGRGGSSGAGSSSGGSQSGGAKDFGKQVAQDTASNLISDSILFGINQAVNGQGPPPAPAPAQKRDPRGGRGGSGSSRVPTAAKDFGLDVLSGTLSGGVVAGAGALINQRDVDVDDKENSYEDAVDSHHHDLTQAAPEKREPLGFLRIIPTLVRAGGQAADVANAVNTAKDVSNNGKRSEEVVVEQRSAEDKKKGKELGKKIGSAIVDKATKSSASAGLARPGGMGYLTAGLAVAVVVGGLNVAI
jgi:hypothetical protein